MPPKKSNKRPKLSEADSKEGHVVSPASTKGASQTSKALELPLELLMEIISYYKAIPIPCAPTDPSSPTFYHFVKSEYLERTDALRALSQTCRLWRNVFFPLLWQRLEACATHSASGAWYQVLGESLIRKSFLVNENQEVASNVRSMSVILSRYSLSTVLPAFVRAIEALPNLTTLQILRVHHHMTTPIKTAFVGHRFPQIRTIMLPSYAHNVLRSCPEVRRVICTCYDASKLVSAIAKECKKVEEVEGFNGNERLMKRLAKAAPNLRSIKFTSQMTAESLRPLAALKNLSHITLQAVYNSSAEAALKDTQTQFAIKVAKDIIKRSPGKKSIVLQCKGYDYTTMSALNWIETIRHDD